MVVRGVLDGPPTGHDGVIDVKVAVAGREGSGKTALIRQLVGDGPTSKYMETLGLQVQFVSRTIQSKKDAGWFQRTFQLWEVGGRSSARFDYLAPSVQDGAHLVIHVVSLADGGGLEGLAAQVDSFSGTPCLIAATRHDTALQNVVPYEDVCSFAERHSLPLVPVANPPLAAGETMEAQPLFIQELFDALNTLLP